MRHMSNGTGARIITTPPEPSTARASEQMAPGPEPVSESPTNQRKEVIRAEDIRKSFSASSSERVDVLRGVSLQASQGELVAIMGPSGSGKSTLMYCLAGLERPTGGSVTVLGTDLASLSRTQLARLRRDRIGFLFQSYNLVPTLSALDNAALPGLIGKAPVPTERLERIVEQLGLTHRKDALPATMSGGEQQRVALARVLAQEPSIVFADEPTGALDTRSGQRVLRALTALAHEDGTCVILVTHDPSVAARCDRVLFLRDGLLTSQHISDGSDDFAQMLAAELARHGSAR